MERTEILAGQIDWASANIAYNLDFIPDDKLNWKPAPSANSALEIVGHMIGAYKQIGARVAAARNGETLPGEFRAGEPQPLPTREEAKTKLLQAAREYSALVRSLTPEDLGKTVELPIGKFSLGFLASMGATDSIHHHGQIAYIQTLLGDTQSHFDTSLLPS